MNSFSAFSKLPLDYMITGDDIEKIADTEKTPISLGQLGGHPYFGRAENCLKLISVLGVLRRFEQLMKLVAALSNAPRLAEAANLELSLAFAMTTAGTSFLEGEGQNTSAAKVASGDAGYDDMLAASEDPATLSVAIKYMLFFGQRDRVLAVLANLPADLCDRVLSHILSINSLIDANIVRLQGPDAAQKWLTFVETLHAVLSRLDPSVADQVLATKVLLQANTGQLSVAAKTVKSISHKYKRLEYYVNMKKSIKNNDLKKAVFFSEKLVQISEEKSADVLDLSQAFDRGIAEQALRDANRTLRDAGIDVFIMSGTLLGCIREGRIFEHDKDFDLGVIGWEQQYDVAKVLMRSPDFEVSARQLRGDKLYLMAARHVPSGYDFDIFFFHDYGDYFRHGIDSRLGYTINYNFSKFTLSEVEFLGDSFYMPTDFDQFLKENYGNDWRIPNALYFVKLESPALEKRHGPVFSMTIMHEMLNMIGKNARLEKRRALVECIERVARKEDRPKKKTIEAFLS